MNNADQPISAQDLAKSVKNLEAIVQLLLEREQRRDQQAQLPVPPTGTSTDTSPQIDNDGDLIMDDIEDENQLQMISQVLAQNRHNSAKFDPLQVHIPASAGRETEVSEPVVLVVDTNFILSHPHILDELRRSHDSYGHTLVFPIVVIHELDGLKKSAKPTEVFDPDIGKLAVKTIGFIARFANDWIYRSLADNSGAVRGQSIDEVIDPLTQGDDAILDCLLYFSRCTRSLTVLLSDDKNLCLKALSNGIPTVSFRPGMTAQMIAEMCQRQYQLEKPKLVSKQLQEIHSQRSLPVDSNIPRSTQSQPSHRRPFRAVQSTVHEEVYEELKECVNLCMHEAYEDDDTLEYLGYTPDKLVTLRDTAEAMLHHWLTVFADYFPPHFRPKPFEQSKGRKHEKIPIHTSLPKDKESLVEFVDFWAKILSQLGSKFGRKRRIQELRNHWMEIISECE